MRLAALLCVLGLASACAEGRWGAPHADAAFDRSIARDSARTGSARDQRWPGGHGHADVPWRPKRVFELTAPSDGTLVACELGAKSRCP
jgi:hypothetical protein